MVEVANPTLSVRRQGELLGLNRSSYYYQAAPESALNLQLMRLVDEQFLRTPFYGWRKMTASLRRLGYAINGKRVRRLMPMMDIQANYPRRSSSSPGKGHKLYPYLLRNLPITHVNQVWSADITYVPMLRGFMYLVAVIDWHSRYVLAWQLSNTLDGIFCLDALRHALCKGRPQIFNTDQGAQFTADAFITCLQVANIQVSMDGRGRALDNIFCERLWRSVKYENIYLNQYDTVRQLQTGLTAYFDFYNHERPHPPRCTLFFPFRGPNIGTHHTITHDHELLSLHGQRRFHPAGPRHPDLLVDSHQQHTVETQNSPVEKT